MQKNESDTEKVRRSPGKGQTWVFGAITAVNRPKPEGQALDNLDSSTQDLDSSTRQGQVKG